MDKTLGPVFVVAFGVYCIVRARAAGERHSAWNRRWLGWGYGPKTAKGVTIMFVVAGIVFATFGMLARIIHKRMRTRGVVGSEPPQAARRPCQSPIGA